jgi:hypothetical protein
VRAAFAACTSARAPAPAVAMTNTTDSADMRPLWRDSGSGPGIHGIGGTVAALQDDLRPTNGGQRAPAPYAGPSADARL